MTRNLFGTDGVRGRANVHPMTVELCMALGRVVARRAWAQRGRSSASPPAVAIGTDTRRSGDMIKAALAAGCLTEGADVYRLGVLPTPGVAYLTRELGLDAGLVVSASHNPAPDNGVKVFGPDGFKLDDAQEAALEAALADEGGREVVDAEQVGRIRPVDDAGERYLKSLLGLFPVELTLGGLHIVVDCAHGAGWALAPQLFERLGARVTAIGTTPTGDNINDGVGATAPEQAAEQVRALGADLAVVLDGDGDRLILVDGNGEPVDGDEVLTLAALSLHARGALRGGAVVATVLSNLGLDAALERDGLKVIRTPVGDRYVVEAMRAHGCNLGGEQSGHIVCLDAATTGDGMAAAVLVLAEMLRAGQPLAKLRHLMTRFPQVMVNVRVRSKPPLEELASVQAVLAEAEAQLGRRGRVLLRYSGTEPKARVMVEGEDADVVGRWAERIAERVKDAIGAEG